MASSVGGQSSPKTKVASINKKKNVIGQKYIKNMYFSCLSDLSFISRPNIIIKTGRTETIVI